MSDRIKKPIRITGAIPPKSNIDKISDVSLSLNHALTTLNNEIQKLRVKSFLTDIPLSQPEIKIVTEAIKMLLATEKQQREANKTDDLTKRLSEMTDAELLEFAKSAITAKNPTTTLENVQVQNDDK